jgi:hypothetical protein
MKQKINQACKALLTKNSLKVTVGSQYFDILSPNISTKIRQNSKSLLGMSIDTRMSRLMNKTGVKNLVGLSL